MTKQDDGLGDLARKYWATLEAIALQTRHILEEMNSCGHDIKEIYMSGERGSCG
jgi:ribulose kinase